MAEEWGGAMIWTAAVIIVFAQAGGSNRPEPAEIGGKQALYDNEAAAVAAGIDGNFADEPGEALRSSVKALDVRRFPWRRVTDQDMQQRSSYWAPVGYRYHRSARVDLNRDGKLDTIEMVENGRHQALRITYGGSKNRQRIVAQAKGKWTDQSIYAAGPNAVMINYPESRFYFLFQRGDAIRAKFIAD